MGIMYERGWGVTQSYTEAMSWYRKAADQSLPEAQYNLGTLYHNGYGTEEHRDALLRLGRTPHHRDVFLRKLETASAIEIFPEMLEESTQSRPESASE